MTQPTPAYLNPDPQLVDGIDVDVVASAVRSCPGVDDLDGGQLGSVTSYLPGRKVAGIKVQAGKVTVQVRSRWDVPIAAVGAQIRTAVIPVIAGRLLDVIVSDIADPPALTPAALLSPDAVPASVTPPQPPGSGSDGGGAMSWTNSSDVYGGNSVAGIIPTAAETQASSSPVWVPSTETDLPG